MRSSGNNTWAIGILSIIGLGIVLITISIIISSSQSIDVDTPFGSKRKVIDKTFNQVMAIQNAFESHFDSYIGLNAPPAINTHSILKNPYYNASVPKDYPPKSEMLGENSRIYIRFNPKDSNDINIESVRLEITRLMQGDKDITKIEIPIGLDSNLTYKSDTFSLPASGYYQVNFIVSARIKGYDGLVYFSRWVFNDRE